VYFFGKKMNAEKGQRVKEKEKWEEKKGKGPLSFERWTVNSVETKQSQRGDLKGGQRNPPRRRGPRKG